MTKNQKTKTGFFASPLRAAVVLCLFGHILWWGCCLSESMGATVLDRFKGTHYALSMRVLGQKCLESFSSRSRMGSQLAHLVHIRPFEGFVLDAENTDIILIGRKSGPGHSLHVDDLVVNMRNIWSEGDPPSCSLDPRSEDILEIQEIPSEFTDIRTQEQGRELIRRIKGIWGPQLTRIGGVPGNSRHAHVMMDADYHMKRASLGLVRVAGLTSYLDKRASADKKRLLKGEDIFGQGISFNRFWFHVKDGCPTFLEAEGITWLEACPIILLTEKQSAAVSGALSDVEEDDPVAIAFSREFSDRFEQAVTEVMSYADLKNLYILKALLEAIYYMDACSNTGCDIDFFMNGYKYKMETPMPDSMPGCVSSKEIFFEGPQGRQAYWHFPAIFGGVHMGMELTGNQFREQKNLKKIRSAVLKARPSPESLTWAFKVY
jgi:hypothetical protein